MNILFATMVLPHQQTTGGEVASQRFIEAMRAAGHTVRVFGFTRTEQIVPRGSSAVATRAIETRSAGLAKYSWLLRSLCSGLPYICEKFRSRRYMQMLDAAVAGQKADLLVIDHSQMGWLLPAARHLARSLLFIAHNHEARLYADEAAVERSLITRFLLKRDSRLIAGLEQKLADAADQIWALSSKERAAFDMMAGAAKTSVMPLAGREIPDERKGSRTEFDIGLLGTWSWSVNGRGLDWFLHAVVPLLPEEISVRVAGRGSEAIGSNRSNVAGLGFADDPVAFMQQARVLAVPTVAGAGIQLKTLEAIASGTPVVSTSLGMRGIDDLPSWVVVADTPADFAAALLRQARAVRPEPSLAHAWAARRQSQFEQAVAARLDEFGAEKPVVDKPTTLPADALS